MNFKDTSAKTQEVKKTAHPDYFRNIDRDDKWGELFTRN